MLLRQNYYWKGMRPEVTRYVKQCKLCRTHNSASTRYVKGMFEVPEAPMDFISMDLIRKFNPPSSPGEQIRSYSNMYAVRLDVVHTHNG